MDEPVAVVTTSGPVVAFAGTDVLTLEAEPTTKVAAITLQVTVRAPVNRDPFIVTAVPAAADAGESAVIDGNGVAAVPPSTNGSRFREPVPTLVTMPEVALPSSAEATVAESAPGWAARYSAVAPATCGAAIDVQQMVLMAVADVYQVDAMLIQGSKTSTQEPKFEYAPGHRSRWLLRRSRRTAHAPGRRCTRRRWSCPRRPQS